MKTMRTLDFEQVSPGQALPPLTKHVTVEQIRQYAEASGDRNPIHLDESFARSAGLSYWESAAYTFAGSMMWEIAGETTLFEEGMIAATAGLTTLDEVLRVAGGATAHAK